MDDEFDKLMAFFSLEEGEKEKKLDEIFKEMTIFMQKYKEISASGNEEDRIAMQKKMSILRDRIKDERESSEKRMGISKEEVTQLSKDEKNFTAFQWAILQNAERSLLEEKDEQVRKLNAQKEERAKELSENTKKSSWLKS